MSRLAVVYIVLFVGAGEHPSRPPTRLHLRIKGTSRPNIDMAWRKSEECRDRQRSDECSG